jgi:hypothetical protein
MQTAIKLLNPLLRDLTDRQREVLVGRFALGNSGEGETLEAIGKRFGVTRERVRQIEAAGLELVQAKLADAPQCADLVEAAKKALKTAGGILSEAVLVKELNQEFEGVNPNAVAFLAAASGVFSRYQEDNDWHPFYYLDKGALKTANQFVGQFVSHLRPRKEVVLANAYHAHLKNFSKSKNVSLGVAENFLGASKHIHQNPFGDKGLTEWAEIKPKTIRDRIYLVLKKKSEPIHFETIAGEINRTGFDGRVALASTVHNELIKDSRFVLVGRGTYGLAEHGYEPGTAKEVIQRILKKHGPLKSKDIVTAVQKERAFKANTILVNLQNREMFLRMSDGAYQIRES